MNRKVLAVEVVDDGLSVLDGQKEGSFARERTVVVMVTIAENRKLPIAANAEDG